MAPPGDVERLFVLEQDGRVRIVSDGILLPTPFLAIEDLVQSTADGGGGEEGLLGLAFHPDYASNGHFFVYHTDTTGDNLVVRYTRSAADPDLADPATRTVVLAIPRDVLAGILELNRLSSVRLLHVLCVLIAKRLREVNEKIVGWHILSGGSGTRGEKPSR